MKKFVSILLALVIIFSLCACGAPNKEAMLDEAITLDWGAVHDEYLANEARAKDKYDGKIVKWTAKIYDIGTDTVSMANETYNGLPVNAISVRLSKDEIISLDKYKTITVVGKLHLSSFSSISSAFVVE